MKPHREERDLHPCDQVRTVNDRPLANLNNRVDVLPLFQGHERPVLVKKNLNISLRMIREQKVGRRYHEVRLGDLFYVKCIKLKLKLLKVLLETFWLVIRNGDPFSYQNGQVILDRHLMTHQGGKAVYFLRV